MPQTKRSWFGITFEGKINFHRLLFHLPIILSLAGLVFIFESSSITAYRDYENSFYFFNRQLLWLIIGIITMILTSLVDFRFWLRISPLIMILALFSLLIVLIPDIGQKVGGARRWIDLGLLSFQPSEIAKLACVLYLTTFLT